ncbi:MAG TPA: small multi-drug export protein [Clostridiales bacterium]|nr:small multi-drug export protein [Clostridiales bacterium]
MSQYIVNLLKIIFISAVPLIEQRGAIPVGILAYKLSPIVVFAASFLGSLLPVPFILLLFNVIFEWMKKFKFLSKLNDFIENKVRKGSVKVERYKELGLIIFVAIPLPTTGLWTGSAVAAFMGLDFKKSFLCVAIGGIISAIIITLISILFPAMLGY